MRKLFFLSVILLFWNTRNNCQVRWYEKESENFKIIYLLEQTHLVNHVLSSAEKALSSLSKLLEYNPEEKISIIIYDINDYGLGAATTVPQNIIRLSIEPFEIGYENMLYSERFYWLLSHELVHIILNDKSTDIESFFRKIFAKVPPEQEQPVSILYSLLTNYGRYNPRWYQEGIAVYLETWLNGGLGRAFSNFDEMFFRTMILENINFPSIINIETIDTHNSFLLETLYYFYGTRFVSYLSIVYGNQKVLEWYKSYHPDIYSGIFSRFQDVFNIEFDDAWKNFIEYEKKFQNKNISKLSEYKQTNIKHLTDEAFGWTASPLRYKKDNSIIFGYHKSHYLASIGKINLSTGKIEYITTIPSPSIYQVSSTAINEKSDLLFFTTNNNMLFRDLWVYDLNTKEKKMLFENVRIGYITVSDSTSDIWGIEHSNGFATLMYSPYPYTEFIPIIKFNIGEEVSNLSVSPSGKYLAAVLHRNNGNQLLVMFDCNSLLSGKPSDFITITDIGSPENPSWSSDNNSLYWNAYNNGVSNIYKKDLTNGNIEVLSHTLKGLFKPVYLNDDSLFVFEFSGKGFIPSTIKNKPAEHLPAVKYLGEKIIEKNPEVISWDTLSLGIDYKDKIVGEQKDYDAFGNIGIDSFIPVISGFQDQKVLGIYSQFSDPLHIHDLKVEIGYSPFNENPVGPKFHMKVIYNYNRKVKFIFNQNATDFYDLFNSRKRGMIGRKITLGYSHYWKYDNPHKIQQNAEVAFYNGVEYINDNLVRVSRPDFIVAQTNYSSTDLRRSIGSSDFESGEKYDFTLRVFGDNPDDPQFAGQLIGEWDNYFNILFPHNTMHIQFASGYHVDNKNLRQARFYFGGFGNRYVENEDVKQYRKVFRFSGIPIYSMEAERFIKIMIENNLPPLRFANLSFSQHFINHIDASIYSQAIIAKSDAAEKWINIGLQGNIVFKHWFNLESTFSAGIAKAWWDNGEDWQWFLSIKLLKN